LVSQGLGERANLCPRADVGDDSQLDLPKREVTVVSIEWVVLEESDCVFEDGTVASYIFNCLAAAFLTTFLLKGATWQVEV
jgi:hypothetical protein